MISAFCIDRTEVTVKAYEACVAANRCTAPCREISPYCNRTDRAGHPVNCVDWHQAVAYCRWLGKRLPSEAEWKYAARGSDGRLYPWGNEPPSATRLNACGRECVAWGKRVLGREWPVMYDSDDGWVTTAPVGSFPAGASPFGALDMAGNVWEWTADWRGGYPASAVTDPRGLATGSGASTAATAGTRTSPATSAPPCAAPTLRRCRPTAPACAAPPRADRSTGQPSDPDGCDPRRSADIRAPSSPGTCRPAFGSRRLRSAAP